MVLDQTGSLAGVRRHDYLPFGEEIGAGVGGRTTSQGYSQLDGVRHKFTGYERDNETGLDFAQARYYANALGRFTSVDPLMASARTGDPQTWNRYTYVYNNPLAFTDPTGLIGDFYNQDGKRLGTDGINDGKIYVVPDEDEAKRIEQANKKGSTTQVSSVGSAIGLPSLAVRQAIGVAVDRSNSPSAHDPEGGFHEEGLQAGPAVAGGQETIVNAAPGPLGNPSVDEGAGATIDLSIPADPAQTGILADITVTAHVHPKGELTAICSPAGSTSGGGMTIGGSTAIQRFSFGQQPSDVDKAFAAELPKATHIVVGAGNKTVYIYNGTGVRATFPLDKFTSIGAKR